MAAKWTITAFQRVLDAQVGADAAWDSAAQINRLAPERKGQVQEAYGFPAFGENPKDPLSRFSDSSFHEACLLADADGRKAVALNKDRASKIGPGKRKCLVCNVEITDPDDYVMIDYICAPEVHPVAVFNYTHLHRSHLQAWPRKAELIAQLEDACRTGALPGEVADSILRYIGLAERRDERTP